MPLNKQILQKYRHEKREERLALHYGTVGAPEQKYTVYGHNDEVIEAGCTMSNYVKKGYALERYTLVKES